MNFDGRTIWITGASSGIGEALARALAGRGARLVLSGRRVEALEAVAHACGRETCVLPFEATDYEVLPGIAERAWNWRDGVDMLINNAGISQRSLAIETQFDVYRRLMEIDFFAPLRLTQLILPRMIERGSGHLAAISSVAGKVGSPLRTGYCAAKHAIVGYFDALRAEVAHKGVLVSVVTPGFVRTGIATNAIQGDGSTRGHSDEYIDGGITPEQAAAAILDGLVRGQREIPVGEGPEMTLLHLKRQDPEQLFDLMASMGSKLG